MGLLEDTPSTKRKRQPSSTVSPSSVPSSGPDSATLQTIQNLQKQIADLEAKEEERGNLTTAQAAKLDALETKLMALTAPPASAAKATAPNSDGEPAGRLAPWCPW